MNIHALVIGNNNYEQAKKLVNAINDAQSVEKMFSKLGYNTTLITDFKRENIADILSDLENVLRTDIEVAIFYFAGHAFEVENNNYIAPIDCPLKSRDKSNCTHYSLRLNEIIDIYDRSKCSIKIIILDACRNDPFDGSDRGESMVSLAPINVTKGYIIAYSTSPGKKASDSPERRNSVYTEAFLSHLSEKHLPIENFFKNVRETVYTLSGGEQVPWEHTSLIGHFCFNQGLFLNSPVGDWYIRSLGVTRNGGYFEYKPMFVEKVPVPKIEKTQYKQFEDLVDTITLIDNNLDINQVEQAINRLIYNLFQLSNDEIDYLESNL
jgi:uncharacterized caspase-like protein